ncbi:MAG: hypothetical protein J6U54_05755 [Clostridiales bacterium]|nr:hypothetical protein [Clostridiales bacterium]
MTDIRIHQCPSCGGNLAVDNERQMYHCSFCGCSFDYEYFHEEQAHELGNTYLSRGEFAAAIDLYKFLLKKNPHDFQALRGMMLASSRTKDIGKLRDAVEEIGFSYDEKQIEFVLENASDEKKDYFKEFEKIFSELKSVSDVSREYTDLRKEKDKINDKINREIKEREDYSIVDRDGVKHDPIWTFRIMTVFISLLIIGAIAGVVAAIVTGEQVYYSIPFAIGLLLIPLVIINLKMVLPRAQVVKGIDKKLMTLRIEAANIQQKISATRNELNDRGPKLQHMISLFVKNDKKIMASIE